MNTANVNMKTLDKDDLVILGYVINPDPDQIGMFYWKNDMENSDISFDSEEEAIAAAATDAFSSFDLCRCDNCGLVYTDETVHPVKHLEMRVESGGVMPSGQCSECGALCYPFKNAFDQPAQVVVLTEPLTLQQVREILDEDNWLVVVVDVDLANLIGSCDMESFNELMEEKIIGQTKGTLNNINYRVVGHVDGDVGGHYLSGDVLIEVRAQYENDDIGGCKHCDSDLGPGDLCTDETCPFSDWPQNVELEHLDTMTTAEIEAFYGIKKAK